MASNKNTKSKAVRQQVRWPKGLRDKVVQFADENGISINAASILLTKSGLRSIGR